MPGNFSHTPVFDGQTITAALYNGDFQNIINNMTPVGLDDYSANLAQMRLTRDPGENGTEDLALSGADELAGLRHAVLEAKKMVDRSITYWYETPHQTTQWNARAEGATGNGTTDDYAAINTMMTAVQSAGGGLVCFPAGTYLITNTIRIPSNTKVYGEGPKTIMVMASTMTTSAFENWGQNTSAADTNITLCDLAVNGNRATPAGAFTRYELNIYNLSTAYTVGTYVANTNVASLRIYYCAQSGTTAASGNGPTGTGSGIADGTVLWDYVEDLWTEKTIPGGHQAAALFSRVTNLRVSGIHAYMSRDNGIILELCYNGRVYDNHCADVNKNCIYLSNNENVSIFGNTFRNAYSGLGIANTWHSSMVGNSGHYIINHFISAGRDCQYLTIVGNSGGTSLPGTGGQTSQADFLVVAESITGTAHGKTYHAVYDDYRYGIYNAVIANNVFTRMQFQLSHNNIIANNFVHNARRDGIHFLGCSNNLVLENCVYNGGNSSAPWAFANGPGTGGALDGTVQSTSNRYIRNLVTDDRDTDGLQRWGFTFTGSPAYCHMDGNIVRLDNNVTLATRFYNWNVDYGVFTNNYYSNGSGDLRFLPTALPTAREELRGLLTTVNGGAGALDLHYICEKNAGDAYQHTRVMAYTSKQSFTVTGTGFVSNPTAAAVYQVLDGIVTVYVPHLTGTSNATTFTLTGIPAAIMPGRNAWQPLRIEDNGSDAIGIAAITASSTTITLHRTPDETVAWTATGTKTLYACLLSWTVGTF